MRKDQNYFDSKAIGSSLLSTFIEDSPDHALIEPKPTNSMERGRIWEDLIEHYMTNGKNGFLDKYYISGLPSFPTSTTQPSIPELMDSDNVEKAIKGAFVWTQSKNLNQKYEKYHDLLAEIEHQDYKRPIPKECWEKMGRMWTNFCKAEWQGHNIVNMLMAASSLKFQQIHYWKDTDCQAECRMKSDIEAVLNTPYGKTGWLGDIKWTEKINGFTTRASKIRWQDAHYTTGYAKHCAKVEIKAPQSMVYIVSEFTAPYLTHVFQMRPDDAMVIQSEYKEHIVKCQRWIKGGKKAVGFREKSVNKYFRIVQ